MKHFFLLCLVCMPLIAVGLQVHPAQAYTTVHDQTNVLNLKQNGSLASPYIVNVTKTMDYVKSINFKLTFTSTTYNLQDFADATALTNGIDIRYNNDSIIDDNYIKTNDNFSAFGEPTNFRIFQDANSPHTITLLDFWDGGKLSDTGLRIKPNSTQTLQFFIQDDLTALTSIISFTVTVEGYYLTSNSYFDIPPVYYPYAINTIHLQDLFIGDTYEVHFNNSAGVDYWVNQTVFSSDVIIKLNIPSITGNMTSLDMYLYDEGTFKASTSMLIQPSDYNPLASFLTFGAFIAIVIIGGIVVFKLISGGLGYLERGGR